MLKKFKYQLIADTIEKQIKDEVLVPGNKLPSLRVLCTTHGISQSTAIAVYYDLESKGYVEANPKSGYYVSQHIQKQRVLPKTSKPDGKLSEDAMDKITELVLYSAGADYIQLSHGVLADELLPIAKLNKAMILAMRSLKDSGTAYGETQGNEKLRRQIVRHTYHIPQLDHEELITTAGCINAISYALMALTEPGDSIAVESPAYFGILRLAKSLKLNVVELPTHPITGIVIESLQDALETKNIKVGLIVSNFSNPLGSLMPDEHKKAIVKLIQQYNIPLIEDDIYGDLYFETRPSTCKSFDESGLVILCSSFSKTLAPGYRIGWIAPGKFKAEILKLKLTHSISSTNITQEVIANFLETGRYDHHLRKLRRSLQTNCIQYTRAIDRYFPDNTKISAPKGGMVLWVEFDKKVNTIELFKMAVQAGISIAPGKMFTLQDQFSNCLRLNYGIPLNEQTEAALKTIGDLAKILDRR
ncbi:PLP-dependent aminotransferase family protein [Flavobacterium sp. '19STA2R22 D10 B1']|uniref:aminotransferase-like domain-containing protein n=1 Tax=Flavobacterium aerium TaxID=3037261 RepID=UPI00278C4CA3|nr:PLP-dependent aminotransferase family protein [Flavobacterium sp. '19STA2R22 D10 B1']